MCSWRDGLGGDWVDMYQSAGWRSLAQAARREHKGFLVWMEPTCLVPTVEVEKSEVEQSMVGRVGSGPPPQRLT